MDFSFFLATPHQSIFPLIVRSSVDPGCLLFVLWRVAGGGCAKIKEGAGAGAPRRKPGISKSPPRLKMALSVSTLWRGRFCAVAREKTAHPCMSLMSLKRSSSIQSLPYSLLKKAEAWAYSSSSQANRSSLASARCSRKAGQACQAYCNAGEQER